MYPVSSLMAFAGSIVQVPSFLLNMVLVHFVESRNWSIPHPSHGSRRSPARFGCFVG